MVTRGGRRSWEEGRREGRGGATGGDGERQRGRREGVVSGPSDPCRSFTGEVLGVTKVKRLGVLRVDRSQVPYTD